MVGGGGTAAMDRAPPPTLRALADLQAEARLVFAGSDVTVDSFLAERRAEALRDA